MTEGSELQDPTRLLGSWRLDRTIDDRRAGEHSSVSGMLDLTMRTPGRIDWTERGRWVRASGEVEVSRRLALVRIDPGWWMRFEDGHDFHLWSPDAEVVHQCTPDTYQGLVTGTPTRWSVRWEVAGPRKDYRMTTKLTRLG